MRKDRTEAAFHTTLRQFPYFAVPMIIGLAAVCAFTPPFWFFASPWHFIKAVAWITGIQFVIGNMWMVPRSIFRPPSEERRRAIFADKILHFTKSHLIESMRAEGAERGTAGMIHLRPTSDFHSLWTWFGHGTYCFSGWPTKKALFLAAGRPDAVIIIDPNDVPPGGILARAIDGAILLDGGYTGPAQVMLLSEVDDQVFAAA